MDSKKFKSAIRKMYRSVSELEKLFPGRHFTPDGNMVGSIGEVYAKCKYKIILKPPNTKGYDAIEINTKRKIQIRTTQKNAVPLKINHERLLVFKLHKDGEIEEIFNGPCYFKRKGKHGITLNELRERMKKVPKSSRVPKK